MPYIRTRTLSTHSGKLASRVSLSAALLTGAISAYAENNTEASLNNVVVNPNEQVATGFLNTQLGGNKFTQPIESTPKTIQVIDKSLLADQHATTLTDALRNSPGVGTFYVGENGNSSTGDTIYMRGFDTSGSIFVDGVRDLGAISRDTFNTEQVEVIKGPSGADYGRTAPSGSINMVSKQAWLENHSDMAVSTSTEQQNRVTLDANQQIGEHHAARLNLMWEDSDIPGRDYVENKRWGVAPAISFGLGTNTRLKLNYLHVTQRNIPDGGALTIGLPGWSNPGYKDTNGWHNTPQFDSAIKPKSSAFYGTKSDFDDVDLNMATAFLEHDFANGVRLHNTTRWGQTKQKYLLSAFMANDSSTWNINDLNSWQMNRLVNSLNQENTIMTNQFGLVHSLNTGSVKHSLSYGAELTREEVKNTGVAASATPAINIYHPNYHETYAMITNGADSKGTVNTASLYFYDNIELTHQLQLTTGVRLDHYQAKYNAMALCGSRGAPVCAPNMAANTPVQSVDAKDQDNLVTYQLGALYQLTEQGNVYVDYAVATQPPGGNSLKMSSAANSADNAKFEPQKAHTIELGSKWQLFNEQMLLSAAIYRTTVDNQVEQDPNDQQYYQNGEKQIQGFEISAVGQITDNLNLSTGYTKLSTKVTDGNSKANDASMDLPYTPSSSFTSWLTYQLPEGFTVASGVRYNGELKRGADGAQGTPSYTESYWVLDAMAGYRINSNLALQLNIYNLLDEDYVAAINKSGYRYTPGQPRSALLNVNLKF